MSLEPAGNRFVRFRGMLIDPEKIENSRLRGVFYRRVYDSEKFLFSFLFPKDDSDHRDHSESYDDKTSHYDYYDSSGHSSSWSKPNENPLGRHYNGG